MSKVHTAVFCDFDGTISRRDVGYSIFHHFSDGRNDELLPDWMSGRMSSREILRAEAAMAPLTETELYGYLDGFEIDAGFAPFVERCRQQGIDLQVVSDGCDLYINYLLAKHDLADLPVITNHAYVGDGHLVIEFPHENKTCTKCGSCKGERIREYREKHDEDTRIIFVGDGFSDACATDEADLVFAKKDLERYCRMHNIEFTKFDTFFDVARELESLGDFAG